MKQDNKSNSSQSAFKANSILMRRLQLRISQSDLAKLAGINQPALSRAENGHADQRVVDRISEALESIERNRDLHARVSGETFWRTAIDLPCSDSVIDRLRAVARCLLSSNQLTNLRYADMLLDALPASVRTEVYAADPDGDPAKPGQRKRPVKAGELSAPASSAGTSN